MRDVLDDLERWQRRGEQIAMATLTDVRGSAPRLPGARFCATRGGEVSGSVSGGCVEADLFEHALQVLDGDQPAIVQYGISDELAFEVGLSCGGEIEVLVEPFRADEVWLALRDALLGQRSAVLAVCLEPASIAGRRMVVFEDSVTTGSVDEALDGEIAERARALLLEGGTRRLMLGAPGEERVVFLEAFRPPPHLFLLGAAFAGPPLARMASEAGFHVTVVDPRSAFATRERFPTADEVIVGWPNEALEDSRTRPPLLHRDAAARREVRRARAGPRPALGGRLHRRDGQPPHARAAHRAAPGAGLRRRRPRPPARADRAGPRRT